MRNTTRSFVRKLKSSCASNHKETRNRKPLWQPAPFEATWEIRFGPNNSFRVLYGIDEEHREVEIQAIGVKEGNRLLVAGKEVEL
jgi:hypothetical protein